MSEQGKRIKIQVNTRQENLDFKGKTIEEIQQEISFLAQNLGDKYFQMLLGLSTSATTFTFDDSLIDKALHRASIIRKIYKLEGFERHLNAYSKPTVEDHIFTAQVAGWLTELGYKVIMEPETPPEMKNPDLRCEKEGEQPVYIECKRINTDNFYKLKEKQELANLIYQKLRTCDELQFTLYDDNSVEKVKEYIEDKSFVSKIYQLGMHHQESTLKVDEGFSIRIIQRPPITGHEEDFPNIRLDVILQNVDSGVRLPGYVFMRGGQTVAIHGPTPSYWNILGEKRKKSKKQSIPDYPFVTIILGEDILGDPEEHKRFLDTHWLTKKNTEFSAVGFLSFAQFIDEPTEPRFTVSINPYASNPLPEDFFSESARSQRGSPTKFEAALEQVADAEPERDDDKLD